ncbi:TrbC/VirB2 family protein [Roseateles sp. BYS96W]|uniref:TrbC/VirB2 family protein n=1 Tax=Pelomonas nitida TaxID=3299027 RepID=A0ABW7G3E9_9BURK
MNKSPIQSTSKLALVAALLLLSAHPAFAQISSTAGTLLGNVNSWMLGIGGVIVTCALMFVGFRMVFQAAEWKDVAPVFWGGVLIGSAAAIGPQLIS